MDPFENEYYRIVIFFDEALIDEMGEQLGVETRVKNYNCTQKFKVAAKDLFYPFNSRQHQFIVTETLKAELDFDKLIKHGVIHDHFPVHNSDRDNIL